jgi:hypothetical protein
MTGLHIIFTRNQAEGALPKGSRVVKVKSEAGDAHPIGSLATVLGSIPVPPPLDKASLYFYFVGWDDNPGVAVGIASWKVADAGQKREQKCPTF